MLRLLDTKNGSYVEVSSARRGLLRVCAHLPEAAVADGAGPDLASRVDLTGLRVLLVADLLARTAELRNLQVQTVLAADGDPTAAEQAADELNVHPPVARADAKTAGVSLGGPIDVHLASHDVAADHGLIVHVGTAVARQPEGIDPLAIRLALLSIPYHQPADLTESALAEADQALARWRLRVAEWAQSPSRPTPAHLADRLRAAGDDLDTASILALLRDLTPDDDVPPGARFETFLTADRILGLDLPRDIGRVD